MLLSLGQINMSRQKVVVKCRLYNSLLSVAIKVWVSSTYVCNYAMCVISLHLNVQSSVRFEQSNVEYH